MGLSLNIYVYIYIHLCILYIHVYIEFIGKKVIFVIDYTLTTSQGIIKFELGASQQTETGTGTGEAQQQPTKTTTTTTTLLLQHLSSGLDELLFLPLLQPLLLLLLRR